MKHYLIDRGAFWSAVAEGAYAKIGDPDILVCFMGKFIAIEAKTPEGRQSEWQKIRQMEIENSGGIYILARSVEDIKVVLDDIELERRGFVEEDGLPASEAHIRPIGRDDAPDGI